MDEARTGEKESKLGIKKKRMMIYFIEATEKLIKEEGIDGLSIRKIAAEAGYNSATLYNYFKDLEHLVLFASVRHLREYVNELQKPLKPDMNALEIYRVIYEVFSRMSFRSPEIFYNMFFGRYNGKLSQVLQQYYELFPDELGEHKGFVRRMLCEGNIYKRDLAFMDALVEEGFVKEDQKEIVVQAIVRTHQSFIAEACVIGDDLDIEAHKEQYMKLFDFIMKAAK